MLCHEDVKREIFKILMKEDPHLVLKIVIKRQALIYNIPAPLKRQDELDKTAVSEVYHAIIPIYYTRFSG